MQTNNTNLIGHTKELLTADLNKIARDTYLDPEASKLKLIEILRAYIRLQNITLLL